VSDTGEHKLSDKLREVGDLAALMQSGAGEVSIGIGAWGQNRTTDVRIVHTYAEHQPCPYPNEETENEINFLIALSHSN
jgi:hypothetical protein